MTASLVHETLRFKNDGPMRKRLFVAEAMMHPAKGHIALWQELVERYSKPGDLILDPMAGIGTSLVAALMGRNVVCVELEAHFVDPMRRSWEKMRNMPMLGYTMGAATIIQGDARNLSDVLGLEYPTLEQNPDLGADVILSSPPYEGSLTESDTYERTAEKVRQGEYKGKRPDVWVSPTNVGAQGFSGGYTRKPVDAIVTSPPYEGGDSAFHDTFQPPHESKPILHTYGPNGSNIGNLRAAAYWAAMRQVYSECWRCLRPRGIMALVLKGFTRDGKYVDLPGQTEALLLEAGWVKHDHWRRELWSLSFWRILQKRRDPAAFDDRLNYEVVLAFRKPEGDGKGVDAVLASPPYEATVSDNKEGAGSTSVPGGWKAGTVNKHGGYTRPSAIITSPPYEGSMQGDGYALAGTLPRDGDVRKYVRKPSGGGYSK